MQIQNKESVEQVYLYTVEQMSNNRYNPTFYQLNNPNVYQELSMDPFNDYQQIIINSLNEMRSNNMIDKETAEVVKPKKRQTRPILRSTQNTQKEYPWKACDLINNLLRLIRDTTDFISKL